MRSESACSDRNIHHKWGADFGPLTLTGDWWRTITCNFIHIGVIHVLMNMYALLYIGIFLEQLIGGRRLISAYFLTGLFSALASLAMHPETISAGASGSIFGLYGIFLSYLVFHHRIEKGNASPCYTVSVSLYSITLCPVQEQRA